MFNPDQKTLQSWFTKLTTFKKNDFHPLVWIVGQPKIGKGTYIGGFSEVNGNGAKVTIGDYCDIASFVTINCADSHLKCIDLHTEIDRKDIDIGEKVFIGSHSVIKGGAKIGHHSVVAAGTIVGEIDIPPYSLVIGNPAEVKEGYYRSKLERLDHE